MKIYPVILSGGAGTRLWPLSRASLPKQLLPVASDRTMLQETVLRLQGRSGIMQPLVVCGDEHRFLVAEQLREISVTPLGILLEPVGRNTAPAAATAAHFLKSLDPEAIMLVLPADHVIEDVEAFYSAVVNASSPVRDGALATFGIVPSAPETGYGYIQSGKPLSSLPGCFEVNRFVEKPDRVTAEDFIVQKTYFWNSGMFMFSVQSYLDELTKFRPAIAAAADSAFADSNRDLTFCRLNQAEFFASPSESIDYAIMERTSRAIVLPVTIGWTDVGAWDALWENQKKDLHNNVTRGDVFLDNVTNSLVRAESRCVAVIGLDGVVVVETSDAVLVVGKDQAQRVKNVVDHLKLNNRTEHLHHTRVYRPWGCYEGIDIGDRFQVKRITVNPGGKLSLQLHHHRAEHWIVVSGTAKVTCGDKTSILTENESTYIPIGMNHRLENPGKLPLHLIEVQSGSYLGEDDIVRLEDVYSRA